MEKDQKKEWMMPSEQEDRAREIREKMERGVTLTREEAGFLGAEASRKATTRAHHEAERAGRGEEFHEAHRTKSWMAGEPTREPELRRETEEKIERIREKQARGETLSREEAGTLGGAARASEEERKP